MIAKLSRSTAYPGASSNQRARSRLLFRAQSRQCEIAKQRYRMVVQAEPMTVRIVPQLSQQTLLANDPPRLIDSFYGLSIAIAPVAAAIMSSTVEH